MSLYGLPVALLALTKQTVLMARISYKGNLWRKRFLSQHWIQLVQRSDLEKLMPRARAVTRASQGQIGRFPYYKVLGFLRTIHGTFRL